jgi:hypothetical protein
MNFQNILLPVLIMPGYSRLPRLTLSCLFISKHQVFDTDNLLEQIPVSLHCRADLGLLPYHHLISTKALFGCRSNLLDCCHGDVPLEKSIYRQKLRPDI